jgi:hypothetical protein
MYLKVSTCRYIDAAQTLSSLQEQKALALNLQCMSLSDLSPNVVVMQSIV